MHWQGRRLESARLHGKLYLPVQLQCALPLSELGVRTLRDTSLRTIRWQERRFGPALPHDRLCSPARPECALLPWETGGRTWRDTTARTSCCLTAQPWTYWQPWLGLR